MDLKQRSSRHSEAKKQLHTQWLDPKQRLPDEKHRQRSRHSTQNTQSTETVRKAATEHRSTENLQEISDLQLNLQDQQDLQHDLQPDLH